MQRSHGNTCKPLTFLNGLLSLITLGSSFEIQIWYNVQGQSMNSIKGFISDKSLDTIHRLISYHFSKEPISAVEQGADPGKMDGHAGPGYIWSHP